MHLLMLHTLVKHRLAFFITEYTSGRQKKEQCDTSATTADTYRYCYSQLPKAREKLPTTYISVIPAHAGTQGKKTELLFGNNTNSRTTASRQRQGQFRSAGNFQFANFITARISGVVGIFTILINPCGIFFPRIEEI